MFSPAKAIAGGALVFAIGGVLFITQPFDQQGSSVPGASTDGVSMKPALVTGILVLQDAEHIGSTVSDGYRRDRDDYRHRLEMSDPRLTGSITIESTTDRFYGGVMNTDLFWGTVRIENDAGVWEGTALGTSDLRTGGREITHFELVGSGTYEGLSALLYQTEETSHDWEWSGIIVPGNLPPDR